MAKLFKGEVLKDFMAGTTRVLICRYNNMFDEIYMDGMPMGFTAHKDIEDVARRLSNAVHPYIAAGHEDYKAWKSKEIKPTDVPPPTVYITEGIGTPVAPSSIVLTRSIQICDVFLVFRSKFNGSDQTVVSINGVDICWIPTENVDRFAAEFRAVLEEHSV